MSSVKAISKIDNVDFSYRDKPFIEGLNLELEVAEFIAILGANGSGKSTILKLLGGLLKPKTGKVFLWGKEIYQMRASDRAKLISYLPQNLDLSLPFSIKEIASMGSYPYESLPAMEIDEALKIVGLIDKKDTPIRNLSGGEVKRAYIAMTLVQGAGILLLDEPLANLDIRYQIEILGLLKRLNRQKDITVVMALHDIPMAMHLRRVILLRNGTIIGDGSPEDTLTGENLRAAFDMEVQIKNDRGHFYISYGG
jgi:iron complex transport system ATP-binding protein